MKTLSKEWEEFYAYAEKNIRGYKRPSNYKERVEKVLNGMERKVNPYKETKNVV